MKNLLTLIRSGGSFETGTLAAQLGTSPQLVQAMLEHLQRSGLIQAYQACSDACGGCSLKGTCQTGHTKDGVRLWQG